jgi:hypothetical protein
MLDIKKKLFFKPYAFCAYYNIGFLTPLKAFAGIQAFLTMTINITIQTQANLLVLFVARGVTNGDWVFLYIDLR